MLQLAAMLVALSAMQAQTTNDALGTTSLLEGPAAGTDTVVLGVTPPSGAWTATANASWLHLSLAYQNGTGSTNLIFSYDANTGSTRSGTLTIAGQTLNVTQAGSGYIATAYSSVPVSSGLNGPTYLAVDAPGNVYIANPYYYGPNGPSNYNSILKWNPSSGLLTTLVTLDSRAEGDLGVAVNNAGLVYIANTYVNEIEEWNPENSNLTTLVSSGLDQPDGITVDRAGNLYIADYANNAVEEVVAGKSNAMVLVFSGLQGPSDVAVDAAGNVYIADTDNNAIKEWNPANSNVTTLVSGLSYPYGVAVDGSGNVYVADTGNLAIKKWTAANSNVTVLVQEPSTRSDSPVLVGVEPDATGDVYFDDGDGVSLYEWSYALVNPTPILEGTSAGTGVLPAVLPATRSLTGSLAPVAAQPWLTINGVTNGVVSFSFTATSSNRTGYITMLGQTFPISQGAATFNYTLGTTALVEGPGEGNDSVALRVSPFFGAWTATANATWLHLSSANQSGAGSTNVIFSFDANVGATRSGTLTIGNQTVAVTQAGSNYAAVTQVTTLVSSGLGHPEGLAVNAAGTLYIGDYASNVVYTWAPSNPGLARLISSGLSAPTGLALDASDNLYIADAGQGAIKEWLASDQSLVSLVPSGLAGPVGVAVDYMGNVFFVDNPNSVVAEWIAANSNIITVANSQQLDYPACVAVDLAGNVYITDTGDDTVKEWSPMTSNLTTLVSAGISRPFGIATDGSGNVYFGDNGSEVIWKWSAANHTVSLQVSSGLEDINALAVDRAGNLYIADTGHSAIKELPRAFLDATPKLEGLAAGNDSLPAVLPATANLAGPFAPTSDQSWLTITGVTNGVVSFSFTADAGSARTADITLLGETIPITQGVVGTPPTLTDVRRLSNGVLQFEFTNTPGAAFTVVSTTNLNVPFADWTVVGAPSNITAGIYQFTSQPTTNDAQHFYGVRSP